ncbi:MAG TPA: hypothetical protein PLY70_00650 [Saprospiraceae bacterium]|nr:hypothetical protein [Saprospiraceae bacterium]HPN71863.1 hypothetical protein [Saprospiraceae bacterium]
MISTSQEWAQKALKGIEKRMQLQQASEMIKKGNNYHVTLVPLPDANYSKSFIKVERFSSMGEKFKLFCKVDINLKATTPISLQ